MLCPKVAMPLGGKNTTHKIKLASLILWYFVLSLKTPRQNRGESLHLQPSLTDSYIRSVMAIMKEEYDWHYSLVKNRFSE